ncbi:MAG: hypothetical protein HC868_12930 [Sphingomonadales bacterium]|nr:hypothetical protein [Sphingomonadales bacterium]
MSHAKLVSGSARVGLEKNLAARASLAPLTFHEKFGHACILPLSARK